MLKTIFLFEIFAFKERTVYKTKKYKLGMFFFYLKILV